MTTTCASCGFSHQPSPTSPRCPSCGASGPAEGGFAPPPMGGVPGQAPYTPGPGGPAHGGSGGGYGAPGTGYGPQGVGGPGHGGPGHGGGYGGPGHGGGQGFGGPGYGGPGYGGPGFAQMRDLDVGWLLWGAIAMVFCCQPFGIAAFVFMDQAKTAYRIGDDARAEQKMSAMRTCIYVGIGLAAVFALLYVGMIVFGVAAAILTGP